MRFISKKDMEFLLQPVDMVAAVEQALVGCETGDYTVPPRLHSEFGPLTLLYMPCFSGRQLGVKLVSLVPDNPSRGLPVLFGIMMLSDGKTGQPLALLDAAKLTALRTGATGATGVKYLAPQKSRRLGIIGTGVQGFHQVLFACRIHPFTHLNAFDLDPARLDGFLEQWTDNRSGLAIRACRSAEELLQESEVIITATTSGDPVIPDDPALTAGRTFVAIGTYQPGRRELSRSVFRQARTLFVDTRQAMAESGDVVQPLKQGWIKEEQVQTLGRLITDPSCCPLPENETRIFKMVGMAPLDLAAAGLLYQKAVEKNAGLTLEF